MKTMRKVWLSAATVAAAMADARAGYLGSGGVHGHDSTVADPPHIAKKRGDLQKLLGELDTGQKEMQGGAVSQARGEELEAKAQEAETLQKDVDAYDRISRMAAKGRELAEEPVLPAGGGTKGGLISPAAEVVGYLSLGQMFTKTDSYKRYIEAGMPHSMGDPFGFKSFDGEDRFVPLTRDDYKKLTANLDAKAVATINAGVIAPQRIAEIVRSTEQRQLRMNDMFNQQQTSSNAVEYVVVIPAAAPAAAGVAEGAAKPETGMELDTVVVPVRTNAVTLPVTEQQLQDIPQIEGIIDTELRYELALYREDQEAWGDGLGQHHLGVFNTPGVLAGRTVVGDTLLDKIRRAVTDVAVARMQPTTVTLHPYESETLDLLKGTDGRYVWAIVTDSNGNMRVWGLQKVESIAMQKPTIGGGNTIHERRVLVGDYVRGATWWNRMQAAVAVGWVNNQFRENLRTLRAEERGAFGVKRPHAFRYVVAQAEAA